MAALAAVTLPLHVAASAVLPGDLGAGVSAAREGRCEPHVASLRELANQPGPRGVRAAFVLGRCLETLWRTAEAIAAYDAAARPASPLRPHALVRAGLLSLSAGSVSGARDRFRAALADAPSNAVAQRARLGLAQASLRAGDAPTGERSARAFIANARADEGLAEAWLSLGRALLRQDRRDDAVAALATAWWAFPRDHATASRARTELLRTLGHLPEPPARARYERATRLADRSEAERELSSALRAGLPSDLAADAWYRIGLIRRGSPEAVEAFRRAGPAPRSRYWLGRALRAVDRGAEARSVWRQLADEAAGNPWAARGLLAIGLAAEASGDIADADRVFAEIGRMFPDTRSGDEARWRRGWIRYREGRYAEAETLFARAASERPSGFRAAASLFWAAKSREKRGADARPTLEQVARRYPLSYHGQLARERLGLPPPPRLPAPEERLLPADRFVSVYEELGALGFHREAAEEATARLEAGRSRELLRFVAIHRARAGDAAGSVSAAEAAMVGAMRGGAPADVGLWMLAYPRAHWEIVTREASRAGVDPLLVLAVMREESRFDPRVVSVAGAVGLMQLMPSTARGMDPTVTPDRLTDPETNIRLGTTYLALRLRDFGGDTVLALAAYNAGAGAARRFAQFRGADTDEFIERIPFSETRAYVKRVLESYGIYRWLYR
jgi:soluble lytic murein transglycosylase